MDKPNPYLQAALQSASNVASQAVFKAEQLIAAKDVAGCYSLDFISALAMISEDEVFDIRRRLRGAFGRDLEIKEFIRRIKEERSRITPQVEVQGWESSLLKCDNGMPRAVIANGISALRGHPAWRGVLAFDEFAIQTIKRKPAPWDNGHFKPGPWRDNDDREAANWFQHNGIMINTATSAESAETVAYDSSFHPVREYLRSIVWDDQPRVDGWLTKYIGSPATEYEKAVGAKWLISAVARVMEPGCKVDHTLILEGAQGKLKSTALKTMGDPWFTDHLPDLSSKDASASLCGVWIIEMGELASLRKTSNIESIKEFLTRQKDRFRPPYGRRTIEIPRQCVFAASTNAETWYADETGGRRFWPVRCGEIDIDSLRRDRDQLWAEAVYLYDEGRKWWIQDGPVNAMAADEQGQRYELDPWDEIVMEWARKPIPDEQRFDKDGKPVYPILPRYTSDFNRISISDVLVHALKKMPDKWVHWDHVRVGKILRQHGWVRFQDRIQGEKSRPWFYKEPS